MKLVIFGASGRMGRELLKQALAQGHSVTVLTRDPTNFFSTDPGLEIVQGNALNPPNVESVVAGKEAVFSTLGPVPNSPPDLLTRSVGNIIAAMDRFGVKRLILQTGANVTDPRDEPSRGQEARISFMSTVSAQELADLTNMVAAIKASDLDWTIVRTALLSDAPPLGNYRVGYYPPSNTSSIPRADLAAFMLKQLTDNTYVGGMPMLAV